MELRSAAINAGWTSDMPGCLVIGLEAARPVLGTDGDHGFQSCVVPNLFYVMNNRICLLAVEGHCVCLSDLLRGMDTLKFIREWPRADQLEAGRFIRNVWHEWRKLGYSKRNAP